MADDPVRVRIRINCNRGADRLLFGIMRDESVQAVPEGDGPGQRHLFRIKSSPDSPDAEILLIMLGTRPAIHKVLATFREHEPQSQVEVMDESGNRLDGYL